MSPISTVSQRRANPDTPRFLVTLDAGLYHPEGRNVFDHLSSQQVADAILA